VCGVQPQLVEQLDVDIDVLETDPQQPLAVCTNATVESNANDKKDFAKCFIKTPTKG